MPRETALQRRMREDAEKPAVGTLDVERIRAATTELLALQERIAADTAALERLQDRAKILQTETIPTLLDEVGVTAIDLDGRKISVVTEYHPWVKKEDEDAFFEWLREHDLDAIIKNEVKIQFGKGEDEKALALLTELMKKKYAVVMKEGVHSATLKAFVKEQQEKGAVLPPMLDINPTRVTKIK